MFNIQFPLQIDGTKFEEKKILHNFYLHEYLKRNSIIVTLLNINCNSFNRLNLNVIYHHI